VYRKQEAVELETNHEKQDHKLIKCVLFY